MNELTSSPMSPPTGTVISTTWLYSPVHSTLRNSAFSDGIAAVMLGKYCISCLGGPSDILGSLARSTELVQRRHVLDLKAGDARSTKVRLKEAVKVFESDIKW